MYCITTRDENQNPVTVWSSTIVKMLGRCLDSAEKARHLAEIAEIESSGTRYSNQDFDVLSAALNFARKNELRRGSPVTMSGYPGAIVRQYSCRMWEVRLPGGLGCFDIGDLRAAE